MFCKIGIWVVCMNKNRHTTSMLFLSQDLPAIVVPLHSHSKIPSCGLMVQAISTKCTLLNTLLTFLGQFDTALFQHTVFLRNIIYYFKDIFHLGSRHHVNRDSFFFFLIFINKQSIICMHTMPILLRYAYVCLNSNVPLHVVLVDMLTQSNFPHYQKLRLLTQTTFHKTAVYAQNKQDATLVQRLNSKIIFIVIILV